MIKVYPACLPITTLVSFVYLHGQAEEFACTDLVGHISDLPTKPGIYPCEIVRDRHNLTTITFMPALLVVFPDTNMSKAYVVLPDDMDALFDATKKLHAI